MFGSPFRERLLASCGVLLTSLAVGIATADQAEPKASRPWTAPRTPWGKPDLQGTWTNGTITPLERPREFADRAFLTDEEATALERRTAAARNADRRDGTANDDLGRAYNDVWWDWGSKVVATKRTSLIVDPPDGRIPAVKPDARAALDARRRAGGMFGGGSAESPEQFSLIERCITRGLPEAMMPYAYNNNYQIIQTPDQVVMLAEMIHDARIIPLTARPPLPASVRRWLGDSRGHWEGDTLVVETTNFTTRTSFRGTSEHLRLVERLTRVAPDMIDYRFTIDDPTTFTAPWTVALPLMATRGAIYEYACHEGNMGLGNMLRIARGK